MDACHALLSARNRSYCFRFHATVEYVRLIFKSPLKIYYYPPLSLSDTGANIEKNICFLHYHSFSIYDFSPCVIFIPRNKLFDLIFCK